MSVNLKILLADDDPVQCRLLESHLTEMGCKTKIVKSGKEAVKALTGKERYDAALLDLMMPDMTGIEVLHEVRALTPDTAYIMLTSNGSVTTVVEAMRAGATDFLVKPAAPERIKISIQNAVKVRSLQTELTRLKKQQTEGVGFEDLIASGAAMAKVLKLAERAARSDIPVLIDGESGTGKEVMARAIQSASKRAKAPFITVNCGALPINLVESILFGHEKGSFTGATDRHPGKFLEADGGTLFLDEVGELPADTQVKLLRTLQEGEIDPVGAKKSVKVNVRILSATNRDLYEMVKAGKFREDLYYRLNVFQITLPALHKRKEDLELLIKRFIEKFSAEEDKVITGVTAEVETALMNYDWPGNIRQLENVIFRAVVMADNNILCLDDFPNFIADSLKPENNDVGKKSA